MNLLCFSSLESLLSLWSLAVLFIARGSGGFGEWA